MKRIILVTLFMGLASCEAPRTSQPSTPAVPAPSQDNCNASQHANLVGQDATALERVLLVGQVRVIRPGQPVTADYRPNRINFDINVGNKITSIRCG